MSQEAREALVDRCEFNDVVARNDLLDPALTSTWLIEALTDLADKSPHQLLITAVRGDHHNDGPQEHWGGKASDLWHANWTTVGDAKIVDVIEALTSNEYIDEVGFGGYAQQFMNDPRFTWRSNVRLFQDDKEDHIHIRCVSEAP